MDANEPENGDKALARREPSGRALVTGAGQCFADCPEVAGNLSGEGVPGSAGIAHGEASLGVVAVLAGQRRGSSAVGAGCRLG